MSFAQIRSIIFPRIRKQLHSDFIDLLYARNIIQVFLLSGFLVLEQLYYAVFVSLSGSVLQKCYYQSAVIMLIFFLFAAYLHISKPQQILFIHRIIPPGFVLVGMSIALLRFVFIEFDPVAFRIPTIYIAVLYGISVIFVLPPRMSISLYSLLGLSSISVMQVVHPEVVGRFYIADIGSNTCIALFISLLNYRNYVKQFIANKTIEKKSADLLLKNQEIQEINSRLKIISEVDDLTQLLNRRKINELLNKLLKDFQQGAEDVSVILLDIDYFKRINDSFGHIFGDNVLKNIARILQKSVRETDHCGRWGGEEFIVICPSIACREAASLAERLRREIYKYSFCDELTVSASFGVSCLSQSKSVPHLLNTADECLYIAKNNGRNMVVKARSDDLATQSYEVFNGAHSHS